MGRDYSAILTIVLDVEGNKRVHRNFPVRADGLYMRTGLDELHIRRNLRKARDYHVVAVDLLRCQANH